MNKNKVIGQRIRMKREESKLTQEELGKQLGVSRQTISKWEKGMVHNIDRPKMDEMALIFHCKTAWLMNFDDAAEVKVTYEAEGREPLTMRISNKHDNPIIGDSALKVKLYKTMLKVPPEHYEIAIELLESLIK